MPIDDDKLYDDTGRAWLNYVSWREKIFAGYLSVLAALAFAFSKITSDPGHAATFAFVILVSAVFRILDYRTTELVNLCQAVGERLEDSKGFYGELNRRRFATEGRPSYGLAIDLLVVCISGTSAVGLFIYLRKWWTGNDEISWWWSLVAIVATLISWSLLRTYSNQIWSGEREDWRKDHPTDGQNKEVREMRWWPIRKAKIDPELRKTFERYGVLSMQMALIGGSGFRHKGSLENPSVHEDAILAWLTEQHDWETLKERGSLMMEFAITVFVALEVVPFHRIFAWIVAKL